MKNLFVLTWLTLRYFYYDARLWAIRQRQTAIKRAWAHYISRTYGKNWGKVRSWLFDHVTYAWYKLERLPSGIIYLLIMHKLP